MALEQNDPTALRIEQLRLAYRNVPQGILGSLSTLLALILILNGVVSWIWLALWSAIALANVGVRLADARRFRESDPGSVDLPHWLPRFQDGVLLSGMVWGGAGVILFPAYAPASQVFLAFVLGGMATGAVGTYSALPGASPRFFIPALLPISVRLLLFGGQIEIAMGLLLVVYGLLLWLLYQRIHAAIRSSLELQIENRRLLEGLAAARKVEERTAARIQQVLLYGVVPTGFPDASMGMLAVSSKAVGGDFYEFFPISERVVDILVGDVMGKGVPAALIGAGAKSRFQRVLASLRSDPTPGGFPEPEEIVASVREQLTARLDELESFITLCYARLDLDQRRLTYVNCGHLPPIRLEGESGTVHYLEGARQTPLGFDVTENSLQDSVDLTDGDVVIFYSDGITEARDPGGIQFGVESLAKTIALHIEEPPVRIVARVRDDLEWFTGGGTLQDDITCLVVHIGEMVEDKGVRRASRNATSSLSELAGVRFFVQQFCEGLDPPLADDHVQGMLLAVNEATANIVHHAYQNRSGERIRVIGEADAGRVVFTLVHSGLGLDSMPAGELDPEATVERGRGLYMMRQSVDSVEFLPWGEGESCVRLTRKRNVGKENA